MPHPSTYGLTIESSEYRPQRDCVTVAETTVAGNVPLRIGHENVGGGGWTQIGYLVLTPAEAQSLAEELHEAAKKGMARAVGANDVA